MTTLKCGRHVVTITNEARILFPKSKITKKMLIDYYAAIAPFMLPHLKNRPLTMLRYPDGITQEGFYQKEMANYFPPWIKGIKVAKKIGGSTTYVVCNNQATLVYLANQACITPHQWLSRIDKLHVPDLMVFDLDPSADNFEMVQEAAEYLKEELERLDLVPFVKTTGSRGLHVTVPLKRTVDTDTVRAIAYAIAEQLVKKSKNMTLEIRKEKRGGRVFVDVLRNGFTQTVAAPYAVRAIEKAPVAAPLTWQEALSKNFHPQQYTIATIFKRLDRMGDPWHDMWEQARSLKKIEKKLLT